MKKDGNESSAVHVMVRVRPQNDLEKEKGGKMAVQVSAAEIKVETVGEESARFTFDKIFPPQCKQSDIFDHIGKPLVKTVFEGYNGTIFAYGQTSSGKTYTMQGPDITDPNYAGIIPRIVEAIFQEISCASENMEFTVRASYVEIYLERIRDLLDPTRHNLQVRENTNKGVYVEGMSEQYVNSFDEMMTLMELGSRNRAQAATGMNEGSSRSHSVFVMQLVQTDTATGTTRTSKINLVDLAGSEMVRKTGATGERLDEAKMINLSLSALGKVINALTDGKSSHVPYRDSKLTRMLQESLGGNARTWLVINVSPSSYNAQETISTLRFGNRAKAIKNKAVVNQVRTVEELELLLAQAERAIDVQARYIEKLKSKLGTRASSSRSLKSEDGGVEDETEVAEKTEKLVEMELKVKEMEETHENDAREIERSTTEIRILTEEIQRLKSETDMLSKAKSAQMNSLSEKLNSVSQDYSNAQNKLDEATSKYERLEHEYKELQLTLATLQKENERLNKELDSIPASTVAASSGSIVTPSRLQPALTSDSDDGSFAVVKDESQESSQPQDTQSRLKSLEEANRRLQIEHDTMKRTYERQLADLQAKANLPSGDQTSSTKASIDPALEQRLYQLIAVHKQLLRKYAYAELAASEKAQLLALKDERIHILEGNLKSKDFNFRAQAERHSLELEELQIEHQRQVQELQLELSKSKREAAESKSFGAKAFSFIQSRTRSPQNQTGGNRIVKPLRGGSVASSNSALASAQTPEPPKDDSASGNSNPSPTNRFLGWLSPSRQTAETKRIQNAELENGRETAEE